MSASNVIPPVPAFYACYLLRSTKRHASQYVGSTPNPIRRLRQHNGVTQGGAVKTSRITQRPWEMVALVTGFPSSVAALQFEWAWQNTHLTRHVSAESRLVKARSDVRVSPKTGKVRRRPARPRIGLTDRLANLHLLLSSASFQRWPLKVTFYAEDVFKMYQRWTRQQLIRLRQGIDVSLDSTSPATTADETMPASAFAIKSLDVGYDAFKPQLEKTRRLIDDAEWLQCSVCESAVSTGGHGVLVCSHEGCNSMSHLTCLSRHFMQNDNRSSALIPTSGTCPGCKGQLHWVDLVKEATLRMRGAKQIEEIFKQKRRKKAQDGESDEDVPEEPLGMDEESDLDGAETEAQELGIGYHAQTVRLATPEHVIEDSEWDDALLLT